MRKLGRMGENTFSLLCSAAGLVANPVQVDETGWDFLVEFDPAPQSLPLDMQEGPVQAKVQVKATENRTNGVQISLSNLHRLAKDPLPTFICMMVFHGMDDVQEIFLLHVDKPLIGKILKTIRKHEANGYVKLHKRSMLVRFPPSTKLEATSSFHLAEVIAGYVGEGISTYTERKLAVLKEIGYEGGRYGLHFYLEPESLKRLIDAYLGHDVTFDVSKVSHYTKRFGIELPEPKEAESGKLHITPKPLEHVVVRFSENKLSHSYAFICKMYVVPLSARNGRLKARVINEFFELTIDLEVNKVHLSLTADENTEATVSDFAKWFKVVKEMTTHNVYMKVEPPGSSALEFELRTKEAFPDLKDEYELVKSLSRIITELDLPSDLKYKLNDILVYEEQIKNLEHALMSGKGEYSIEFSRDTEINDDLDCGKTAAGIVFFRFRLPNHYISLIFTVCGELTKRGDGLFEISGNEGLIKHKWIFENNFPDKDEVQSIIDIIVQEYEADGITVFIPNSI